MSNAGPGIIVPSAVGLLGGAGKSSRLRRSIGPMIANVTIEERHEDELEITDHPIEQGASITDHAFKRPPTVTIKCGWSNSPIPAAGILGNLSQLLNSVLQGQAGNVIRGTSQAAINGSGLPVVIGNSLSQGAIAGAAVAFTSISNSATGQNTTQVQDVYQSLLALQVGTPQLVNGQTVNSGPVLLDIYTGKRFYSNMLIKSIVVETDQRTENSLIATIVCRQVIVVQTQTVSVGAPPEDQANPEKTQPTEDNGTKQLIPVGSAIGAESFPVSSGNIGPLS